MSPMAKLDLDSIPIVNFFTKTLSGEDIDYGFTVFVIGLAIIIFGLGFVGVSESTVITFAIATSPIWLPYVTFIMFFNLWMEMVGKKFTLKTGRVIYEIILPPEVLKSPEAMEMVLEQILNKSNPDNLMETYLDGKRPPNYTFELVSRGGSVHFYATIPGKGAQGFTDAIYSQYPGVELRELEIDYTAEIPKNLKDVSFFSFHIAKKKGDTPPIKTYIDMGMDKLPKEEEKIDPMTPMLEVLAGIRPDQQLWVQYIFKAHREKSFLNGQLKSKGTWEKGAQAKVDEIMNGDGGGTDFEGLPRLTPGQRSTVESIERTMGKAAFDFAGRMVYISTKGEGNYDGSLFSRMSRMIAAFDGGNGIGIRWRTDYNYKLFSDPFGKKVPALKKAEIKEYKSRKLYAKSGAMKYAVITSEELATIFHLPGSVAITPTLQRVGSVRSEAPANLPTGELPH